MFSRAGDMALAALGVVTVLLVGILVERQQDLTVATDPGSSATSAAAPSEDPSERAKPTTEPSPQQTKTSSSTATSRVTDARGSVILHATSSPCAEASAPATLTLRQGESTQTLQIDTLRTITGLQVIDADRLRLVGGDFDCQSVAMSSEDGGATWQRDDDFAFWSLVPDDERGLVHAGGTATAPCEAVTVSGIDLSVARVLCQDARVFGTADSGEEWVVLGRAPSALGASYAGPAIGFALVEEPDCDGIAVHRTSDGGATWESVHCAAVEGPWAISSNNALVAVVGERAFELSDDAGDSWRSRSL